MEKPNERDGVTCPEARDQTRVWPPEKVYEVAQPKGPPIRRGILGKHKHGPWWNKKEECPWSGMPVPVVPRKLPGKE